MSKRFGAKFAFLISTAVAGGFAFAPATQATPVNYDFSVGIITEPSLSTTGTFSYDSTSVIPGSTNKAIGLLTALDFTFNGITYDATTANTGSLTFDADGNLTNIQFGSNCTAGRCALRGNSWFSLSGIFTYVPLDLNIRVGTGRLTFSLAAVPVAVPEPSALGLFGLGALMIGLVAGGRRRRVHHA